MFPRVVRRPERILAAVAHSVGDVVEAQQAAKLWTLPIMASAWFAFDCCWFLDDEADRWRLDRGRLRVGADDGRVSHLPAVILQPDDEDCQRRHFDLHRSSTVELILVVQD